MTNLHKTSSHMTKALSLKTLRHEIKAVEGFNAKVAVLLTKSVGTMACAYVFTLIALVGLAPALKPGGSGFVPWFAQTFLQLVLLSVIMVGQSVQSAASDARSEKTYEDTVIIIDKLDDTTKGGITLILERLDALEASLPKKRGS